MNWTVIDEYFLLKFCGEAFNGAKGDVEDKNTVKSDVGRINESLKPMGRSLGDAVILSVQKVLKGANYLYLRLFQRRTRAAHTMLGYEEQGKFLGFQALMIKKRIMACDRECIH